MARLGIEDGLNTKAEKYRLAARAALQLAHRAKDEAGKASWLRHYEDWTRLAEEAELSGNVNPKKE
jgi:hypothetical protein